MSLLPRSGLPVTQMMFNSYSIMTEFFLYCLHGEVFLGQLCCFSFCFPNNRHCACFCGGKNV